MLFVRFLQLFPPEHPQSLCRFADAAYPREGTETGCVWLYIISGRMQLIPARGRKPEYFDHHVLHSRHHHRPCPFGT